MIETIISWIFTSSADPSKTSLTVKAALIGIIPIVMQASSIACGFHAVCISLDGNVLQTLVETIANLIFLLLSVVSVVGTVVGLARKIWRTVNGTNLAI